MQHCFTLSELTNAALFYFKDRICFLGYMYIKSCQQSKPFFFFAISIQIIKLYILSINVAATVYTCHILNC